MNLFADIRATVITCLEALTAEGVLPAGLDFANVAVEPPRDASHGDMATNAAMVPVITRNGREDVSEPPSPPSAIATTVDGSTIAPAMLANDMNRVRPRVIAQTVNAASAGTVSTGHIASTAPNPVATPLPPRNPSQGEKQ